ncbi:MAG: hypothetical protein ABSF74_01735 [Dehalococcoidia bacterium]|jgi:hypothetical protein
MNHRQQKNNALNNVLIVGASWESIDSCEWWQDFPNLSDYDTVILDTTSILMFWLNEDRIKTEPNGKYLLKCTDERDNNVQSNVRLVKRKLTEMLQFPVSIYVLYAPTIEIWRSIDLNWKFPAPRVVTENSMLIATNDWCPIAIHTHSESGKTIEIIDDKYKQYFQAFREWSYFFIPESLKIDEFVEHYKRDFAVTHNLTFISTNKVAKPLAVQFQPFFHEWFQDKGLKVFSPQPTIFGGTIVLLPTRDTSSTKTHIEAILKKIKVSGKMAPPNWISDIEMPGEDQQRLAIHAKRQQLVELEKSIEELDASLIELQEFKSLLFETGPRLQNIVKLTFDKLGIKTKPSIVTDEFIIVTADGQESLVEVKGNGKSITKDDIAQLVTDSMAHLKETGQEIHAILIGNGWRLESLDKRETKDKPTFSKDAVKVAENHGVRLLTTTELFWAYYRSLTKPQLKTEIQDRLMGTEIRIKLVT